VLLKSLGKLSFGFRAAAEKGKLRHNKEEFLIVKGRIIDSDSPNPNLRAFFAGEKKDSVLYPKDSNLFGIRQSIK
jgi:hypothetical protein